jgi:hypothetical protein
MVAWIFSTRVERPKTELRLELQAQILSGQAPEPYRFRMLFPWLADALTSALESVGFDVPIAHALAFLLLNTFFLSVLFRLVWDLASRIDLGYKILALALLAAAWNIALFDHFYQPWSIAEGAFVVSAFWIARRRYMFLIPLVAVLATLNRDTGVLIPLSLFIYLWITDRTLSRNSIAWLLVSQLAGIATFLSVRVILGPAVEINSLDQILSINFAPASILYLLINLTLFLGPASLVFTQSSARAFARPWAIAFLPQLIVIIPFGVWAEVRLYAPYIFFLPIAFAIWLQYRSKDTHNAN